MIRKKDLIWWFVTGASIALIAYLIGNANGHRKAVDEWFQTHGRTCWRRDGTAYFMKCEDEP